MSERRSDERRKAERAELSARVRWNEGDRTLLGEAQDVSARGLSFVTEHALRRGARLELVIELPTGYLPLGPEQLAASVRVVRCTPTDGERAMVAVEFVELGEAEEEALAKYVRRRTLIARSA